MKFVLRTHGCRANQYDSEAVRSMMISSGATEVAAAEDADVAIFNSCSVTAAAEAELRKEVRRAARANPLLRTIVVGCAPGLTARDEKINPLRTLPTVMESIVGADLDLIASVIGLPRDAANAARGIQTGARGLLRIQEGCDEHCTFCAATLARGSNRSRAEAELIEETGRLAEVHPEIVLTGIHIGSYGLDIGSSLSALVERLIAKVPAVRFRLSSLEATEVDARLRDLFAIESRLAPYLHAPLQSGSDRILKRMGRSWYTASQYETSIERIVSNRNVFGLGADIICGFPGETEEDHRETVALVERLPFTSLHVFPYSTRPGAVSGRLSRQVGSSDAQRRCAGLRCIAALKSAAYRASRAGGRADIVAIAPGEGLTEDYLSVDILTPAIRRRDRFAAILAERQGRLTAIPTATPTA